MKKQYIALFLLFLLLLSGCSDPQPPIQQEELKPVEQVGQVPDELIEIVEKNLCRYILISNADDEGWEKFVRTVAERTVPANYYKEPQ